VGHLARNLGELSQEHVLRQAMAYGTSLASFNVEEFGTERVHRLTAEEIRARVDDLQRMTQFAHDPLPLS
jgi:hypothetical protein